MKKVLVVLVLGLTGLTSCKKDCTCTTVQEMGKLSVVKGEIVTTWKITDTLNVSNECSEDGNINQIENTLRTRVICD